MGFSATEEGNILECPQWHSQIKEIGSGLIPVTTGPRDLITDEQTQHLLDLGETKIPRFQNEATARLKELIGTYDSWLASCFSRRRVLQTTDERRLQAALRKAGWNDRLPKDALAFTEDQRLEYLRFVKETPGTELFQKICPKNINKYAEALGVPRRNQKEKEIRFGCPRCGQTYSAPEEMAGSTLNCQACNQPLQIPRPPMGFYATPSKSQLEDAFLSGVSVHDGMHRGELKAELARAYLDPSRTPPAERYEQQAQRRFARALEQTDGAIAEIEQELLSTGLTPARVKELNAALKEAKQDKEAILDEESERKHEIEREAIENAREEAEFRRSYEAEFARGGDWGEFYRKPTREQFDAVYAWLDQKRPGWSGIGDITDGIDRLFPESGLDRSATAGGTFRPAP